MLYRSKVSEQSRERLMETALGRIKVVLLERNPCLSQVMKISAEYIAEVSSRHQAWTEETELDQIGLDEKIVNILIANGILNVRALIATSAEELMRLKNFGPNRLETLRWHLSDRGVYLRGEGKQTSENVLLAFRRSSTVRT